MTSYTCELCGGQSLPMGILGGRLHLRCRSCGAESSIVECGDCERPIASCVCHDDDHDREDWADRVPHRDPDRERWGAE